MTLNARQGAVFHIPFPVAVRSSFGLFGGFWCTFNRGAMAWCVQFKPIGILHFGNAHQAFGMGYKPASAVIVSKLCSGQCGQALIIYVSFCLPSPF